MDIYCLKILRFGLAIVVGLFFFSLRGALIVSELFFGRMLGLTLPGPPPSCIIEVTVSVSTVMFLEVSGFICNVFTKVGLRVNTREGPTEGVFLEGLLYPNRSSLANPDSDSDSTLVSRVDPALEPVVDRRTVGVVDSPPVVSPSVASIILPCDFSWFLVASTAATFCARILEFPIAGVLGRLLSTTVSKAGVLLARGVRIPGGGKSRSVSSPLMFLLTVSTRSWRADGPRGGGTTCSVVLRGDKAGERCEVFGPAPRRGELDHWGVVDDGRWNLGDRGPSDACCDNAVLLCNCDPLAAADRLGRLGEDSLEDIVDRTAFLLWLWVVL